MHMRSTVIYSANDHSDYIGEVVEGMDVVKTIEGLGSASGNPKKTVTIAASGVV
jgi:peptidylprolyl isomerase